MKRSEDKNLYLNSLVRCINYIKIKFSNMVFENISLHTGEVLETLTAQGDFVVSITYERLQNID